LNLVDGCVKMGARCWTKNSKFWLTQCDLLEKILNRLDRENITLAGRRQAIRVFHETPLQLSGADGHALDADMPEESVPSATEEASFKAVNDDDEM